jgi:glutamyl aminopeptidase
MMLFSFCIVSMKWWNDLWLNEGFASYIEFKGETAAEPSWEMETQFTIDTMHSVLDLDATLGSHSIVAFVETPDQITEIFDSITYNKGASIIRMIEDFVGADNFQKGVTDYLNEMRYGNADSDDLLRNLKKYTDLDIFSIVNTWIRQKGIPVVTLEKVGNDIHLTQRRFLTDSESESKETVASEFNYKWSIPITYFTNVDATVKREWFNHTMDKLVLPIGNADWVKVNKNQNGYYRVNYDKSMWESMNEELKANIDAMSVLDRAHLLNDVFSLAQGLKVDYSTALKMTEFLQSETSFVPWDVASTKLKSIRNLLYNTEYYREFRKYVNTLVDEAYKNVSWVVDIDQHLVK